MQTEEGKAQKPLLRTQSTAEGDSSSNGVEVARDWVSPQVMACSPLFVHVLGLANELVIMWSNIRTIRVVLKVLV